MDREQYERVRELYHELADLPPAARGERLRALEVPEPLRRELQRLIGHHPALEAFDEARLGALGALALAPVEAERPGLPAEIAGFRITGLLGRGGMGVVYRGVQERPRREVAVKVLQALSASPEALRRFEYEAEILARLDHPCVAKVFQAGVDAAHGDVAYLAMELVSGVDLLAHCDAHDLGARERVELFCAVCDGVEHAHLHGIVHRDLKPANILVSADGRPRLLDFGIARPAHTDDVSTPGRTQAGSLIGSLAWMSPEQARGEVGRVDLRTDVYSLGLLLYRLLAGEMPYDVTGLQPWEAARRICDEEPRRLGSRSRALRGDLEAIVAMALEKDPDRRYSSAGALGGDLRRFLADQPVEARPWSGAYQIRKFARRHRLLVGAAGVLLAALLAGLVSGLVLWRRSEDALAVARREGLTSARVERFLVDMLTEENPYVEGSAAQNGKELTVAEVLDRAAPTIARELAEEPLVRARLMGTIGNVYSTLGHYGPAVELLRGAVALQRDLVGADDPAALRTRTILGRALSKGGRLEEAQAELGELYERQRRVLGPEHPDTLDTASALALLVGERGHLDLAEELLRNTLDARRRVSGPEDPETLSTQNNLATLLLEQGRTDEAEALLRETLAASRRVRGPAHPETLALVSNLAGACSRRGAFDEALALLEVGLTETERVFGPDHPNTLAALHAVGLTLLEAGRPADAEASLERAFEASSEVAPGLHLAALRNLASVYEKTGRLERSIALLEEGVGAARARFGPESPLAVQLLHAVGTTYAKAGRSAEALPSLRETAALAREVFGDVPITASMRRNYVGTLARAHAASERDFGPEDVRTLALSVELAGQRGEDGDVDGAEALYTDALAAYEQALGADHPDALACLEALVRLEQQHGRREQALALAQELVRRTPPAAAERAAREGLQAALEAR